MKLRRQSPWINIRSFEEEPDLREKSQSLVIILKNNPPFKDNPPDLWEKSLMLNMLKNNPPDLWEKSLMLKNNPNPLDLREQSLSFIMNEMILFTISYFSYFMILLGLENGKDCFSLNLNMNIFGKIQISVFIFIIQWWFRLRRSWS